MSEVVTRLPEGLRLDDNLTDRFYVGYRESKFKPSCAEPAAGLNATGYTCDDEPSYEPDRVYIDDHAPAVYVPIKDGRYRRYAGKADNVVNGYGFWERDELLRYRELSLENFKYEVFGASRRLSVADIRALLAEGREEGIEKDLYAYIVEKMGEREDIAADHKLVIDAAVFWLGMGEGQTRYYPLAREALRKIFVDPRATAKMAGLFGYYYNYMKYISERHKRVRRVLREVGYEAVRDERLNPYYRRDMARYLVGGLMGPKKEEILAPLALTAMKEGVDPKARAELAEFVLDHSANGETRSDMAGVLLGLARDPANVPPEVCLKSARTVASQSSRLPGLEDMGRAAVDALFALSGDKRLVPPDTRLGAARYLYNSYNSPSSPKDMKSGALRNMYDIATDASIADRKTVHEAAEFFLGRSRDPAMRAGVRDALFSFVNDGSTAADRQERAAWQIEAVLTLFRLPEEETAGMREKLPSSLLAIADNQAVRFNTRADAARTAYNKAAGPAVKERALRSGLNIVRTGDGDWDRRYDLAVWIYYGAAADDIDVAARDDIRASVLRDLLWITGQAWDASVHYRHISFVLAHMKGDQRSEASALLASFLSDFKTDDSGCRRIAEYLFLNADTMDARKAGLRYLMDVAGWKTAALLNIVGEGHLPSHEKVALARMIDGAFYFTDEGLVDSFIDTVIAEAWSAARPAPKSDEEEPKLVQAIDIEQAL